MSHPKVALLSPAAPAIAVATPLAALLRASIREWIGLLSRGTTACGHVSDHPDALSTESLRQSSRRGLMSCPCARGREFKKLRARSLSPFFSFFFFFFSIIAGSVAFLPRFASLAHPNMFFLSSPGRFVSPAQVLPATTLFHELYGSGFAVSISPCIPTDRPVSRLYDSYTHLRIPTGDFVFVSSLRPSVRLDLLPAAVRPQPAVSLYYAHNLI
jgi:hypothetical protein